MFITLSNHDASNKVDLAYGIDNCDGNKEATVHEVSYTIKWLNVTGTDYYIDIKKGEALAEKYVLPEGYYNFCILKETLFDPIDVDITLNKANLKVKISFARNRLVTELTLSSKLAELLGFKKERLYEGRKKTFVADTPINFGVYKLLYIYLQELNSAENLHNGVPSTLLRIVSAGTLGFCDTEVIRFPTPQFKSLQHGHINALHLHILGDEGKVVDVDNFCVVLEIRNKT